MDLSEYYLNTEMYTSDCPAIGLPVSQLASEDGWMEVVKRKNRSRVAPEDGRGSGGSHPSSPKVMLQSSTKNISNHHLIYRR